MRRGIITAFVPLKHDIILARFALAHVRTCINVASPCANGSSDGCSAAPPHPRGVFSDLFFSLHRALLQRFLHRPRVGAADRYQITVIHFQFGALCRGNVRTRYQIRPVHAQKALAAEQILEFSDRRIEFKDLFIVVNGDDALYHLKVENAVEGDAAVLAGAGKRDHLAAAVVGPLLCPQQDIFEFIPSRCIFYDIMKRLHIEGVENPALIHGQKKRRHCHSPDHEAGLQCECRPSFLQN